MRTILNNLHSCTQVVKQMSPIVFLFYKTYVRMKPLVHMYNFYYFFLLLKLYHKRSKSFTRSIYLSYVTYFFPWGQKDRRDRRIPSKRAIYTVKTTKKNRHVYSFVENQLTGTSASNFANEKKLKCNFHLAKEEDKYYIKSY